MTIRRYRESDREALVKLESAQDFKYPALDSPLLESCWVAADDHDRPLMAISAYRTVELYLYVSQETSPVAALNAGQELFRNISDDLRYANFNEAEGFISPRIEHSFGRHIQKHFNALRNWASFKFRF